MKLYLTPGTCAQGSHIALIEAGQDFTTEIVPAQACVGPPSRPSLVRPERLDHPLDHQWRGLLTMAGAC